MSAEIRLTDDAIAWLHVDTIEDWSGPLAIDKYGRVVPTGLRYRYHVQIDRDAWPVDKETARQLFADSQVAPLAIGEIRRRVEAAQQRLQAMSADRHGGRP